VEFRALLHHREDPLETGTVLAFQVYVLEDVAINTLSAGDRLQRRQDGRVYT